MTNFKVITLNCWGVFTPLACELRHERLAAIAETLSEGKYDIIFLQEIWTDGDFEKMRKVMQKSYPHSHYFHSNLIGSGCCIMTKFPIQETFYLRYSANGYPHRIQHGDWFGGKGVGMARLALPDKSTLACYVTHLHAQYNKEHDEYESHRLVQAYELSTFIRLTSIGADAAILCGDMNLTPQSLGMQLIRANAALTDAWLHCHGEAADGEADSWATCDRPGNSFCGKIPCPERLDYILFASSSCNKLQCTDCQLALGKVPNQSYNYSDHEAVQADFQLSRDVTSAGSVLDWQLRSRVLNQCLPALRTGYAAASAHRLYYAVVLLLSLFAVFCLGKLLGGNIVGTVLTGIGGGLILFLAWNLIVVKKAEMRALLNTQLSIERILSAE